MASFLDSLDYQETSIRKEADLIVINTCGVKQTSESRVYGLVPRLKKDNPAVKVVVTGCVSDRPDVQRRMKQVDLWLPVKDMTKLAEFLQVTSLDLPDSYLKIAPKYNSKISAQIPIGTGCDNFCSYCVVPYARGREVYRAADEIVAEVRSALMQGVREINLIAQNVNSYHDKSLVTSHESRVIAFPELLRMVNDLPGDFWIRFVSSHPKDMSDDLILAMAECDKVCKHIHLPVQAGDDEVLTRMNRKYTAEHYRNLLTKIRTAVPEISITTDIIIGYPSESAEQFTNTLELARWARFDNIYIGKYSPRPFTAAYKLKDDVTQKEKREREELLLNVLKKTAADNHQRYLNKETIVLVEEKSKGLFFGRISNNTFVKILTKTDLDLVGQFVKVKIVEARDFGMDGELV